MIVLRDGVKVFIKNSDLGKYLFFLRDDKSWICNPNRWDLLGGALEENESSLEALKREIEEESNVKIFKVEKLGCAEFTHLSEENAEESKIMVKNFIYLAETKITLDKAQLHEGQKFEYFTIDEIMKQPNVSPLVREAMEKYKNKIL